MNQQIFVTPTQAARLLGIDRRTLMISVRDGTIPSTQLGRSIVIPLKALERLAQVKLEAHRG
jgi:excisionase family DNA binding protein